MKKNYGVLVLLASIVFTTLGSIKKIMHTTLSDIFLVIGVAAFIVGMVMILRQLFRTT